MTTTAQTNGRGQETYRDFSQMNFEGTIKRPERREEGISGATDYSAFAHKQAEVLHTLKGLVMMAEFENKKERLLVLRLFRIFERDWTAHINNRTARILEAEAGADKWRQRMAADDAAVEGTPDADDLLAQWSTGAKMLAEAFVQKRLHGLQHVRHTLRKETIDPILLVPRVRTARELLDQCREDMRQARYQAASLPPAASEYFWNRVTALQISIERSTDIALGIPVVDYLQVKEDLARGVHVALVADRMPWSYQEIADRSFSSMGGNFLEYLSIWQIGMWPWTARNPRRSGDSSASAQRMRTRTKAKTRTTKTPSLADSDRAAASASKGRGRSNAQEPQALHGSEPLPDMGGRPRGLGAGRGAPHRLVGVGHGLR